MMILAYMFKTPYQTMVQKVIESATFSSANVLMLQIVFSMPKIIAIPCNLNKSNPKTDIAWNGYKHIGEVLGQSVNILMLFWRISSIFCVLRD